jgi:cobyrinic acid a,c-diamide synthase
MAINGIMIAATSSGSGKTTVSAGIMRALSDRGMSVQPFKVGPDYIDPGFHRMASGNTPHNLDPVMGSPETVREIYYHNSEGSDISIVEGVMGLYDGAAGKKFRGSSFDVARILGLPVILIVDISSSGQSAAATVMGFRDLDKRVNIAGVIMNRAGTDYHCSMVREAIEHFTGIKVLGCMKRSEDLKIRSRYLGLVTTVEKDTEDSYFQNLAEKIRGSVDLDSIIRISREHGTAWKGNKKIYNFKMRERARIGVAYDRAFSFYYAENIEILEKYGGVPVYFDPITDKSLPDIDGLYIGGGYPELYARELSGNKTLMWEIRDKINNGMPVFAECGGYMYLSESITVDGDNFPMVGAIPATVNMKGLSLGYRDAAAASSGVILEKGQRIRGHEFHYSRIEFHGSQKPAYEFKNGACEGYNCRSLTAGYLHVYFPSNQNAARRFVLQCINYRQKNPEL